MEKSRLHVSETRGSESSKKGLEANVKRGFGKVLDIATPSGLAETGLNARHGDELKVLGRKRAGRKKKKRKHLKGGRLTRPQTFTGLCVNKKVVFPLYT